MDGGSGVEVSLDLGVVHVTLVLGIWRDAVIVLGPILEVILIIYY